LGAVDELRADALVPELRTGVDVREVCDLAVLDVWARNLVGEGDEGVCRNLITDLGNPDVPASGRERVLEEDAEILLVVPSAGDFT
jgi:hypothetical protein